MKVRPLFAGWLLALLSSIGGCGGGGSVPASNIEPFATQPLEVAAPVVTPTHLALLQPTTGTSVTPVNPVTPGSVLPSEVVTAANSCGLVNFQADVMIAINGARAQPRSCGSEAKAGVPALVWNDALFTAATAHSQDMAQRNYFSHTSPDGKTVADRAQTAGYRFTALGENIAAGQLGIAAVMQGWLASEGHCRNIMNATFTEVAVACVASARQPYPTYWTMTLGKPA